MYFPVNGNLYLVETQLREMRQAAEQARLVREARAERRQPKRIRRQVGGLLIAAGEALAR